MRLTELHPQWLELNGEKIAIMFRCPHCLSNKEDETWLTCFFRPIVDLPVVPEDYPIEGFHGYRMHRVLFHDALRKIGHPDPVEGSYHNVVSCKKTIAWQRTGDNFETLTCSPSIDASQSSHWHGHIQNGNIV